jgi:flagellar biosynthesis chaperone FliJ
MKALYTLIKLNKKKLDELLINKKTILGVIDNFNLKIKYIETQIKTEMEAHTSSEFSIFLENFVSNSNKKLEKLKYDVASFQRSIAILESQISEQYSELKRFEIILTNEKQKALKKEKVLETKVLDELTIIKFNQTGEA